ncbi:MAG: sugar-binding transcriptional regulator [Acetanaerobacterium sp.]
MRHLSEEQQAEHVRVAYYYYKVGLTQEQIAGRMHLSRQRINRILGQCVELGIVQINIAGYEKSHVELETRLEERYRLQAVRIVGHVTAENAYSLLGLAAAKYLAGIIQSKDVIGFSRGRAMSSLVHNLPRMNRENLMITQLMGSWNSQQTNVNVDDIVHRAAENFGASTTMLYAPAVVNKRELRDSIMREPFFMEAYEVIRSCTIAAVGIGELALPLLSDIPLMNEKEYQLYRDKQAVGEICAHFFDRNGRAVTTEFDERTIVVALEDYLSIPLRIGVAGLPSKLSAIQGALIGGYINVLVTDLDTAEALIDNNQCECLK